MLIGHKGRAWRSGGETAKWIPQCAKAEHDAAVAKGEGREIFSLIGVLRLRRFAISGMIALELDGKTVASITGHRTVSLLLNTYARTSEKRQTAAVEALARATTVPP